MRILKLVLIVALALVSVLYGFTTMDRYLSGSHIPPTIRCEGDLIQVSVSDPEEVMLQGVTASDQQDGDLTDKVLIQGVSKLVTEDTAKVTYLVFDSDGNAASCSRMIRYTDYCKPLFSISEPLIYTENQDIRLLDRLHATDVLDGDITGSIRVSTLFSTSDPEIRNVTVQVTNSMGDTASLTIPIVIHSGTVVRPQVHLTEYLIYLDQGSSFDPMDYLDSVSTPIGPGNVKNVEVSGVVYANTPGTYHVFYRYPYSVTTGVAVLTVVIQ